MALTHSSDRLAELDRKFGWAALIAGARSIRVRVPERELRRAPSRGPAKPSRESRVSNGYIICPMRRPSIKCATGVRFCASRGSAWGDAIPDNPAIRLFGDVPNKAKKEAGARRFFMAFTRPLQNRSAAERRCNCRSDVCGGNTAIQFPRERRRIEKWRRAGRRGDPYLQTGAKRHERSMGQERRPRVFRLQDPRESRRESQAHPRLRHHTGIDERPRCAPGVDQRHTTATRNSSPPRPTPAHPSPKTSAGQAQSIVFMKKTLPASQSQPRRKGGTAGSRKLGREENMSLPSLRGRVAVYVTASTDGFAIDIKLES